MKLFVAVALLVSHTSASIFTDQCLHAVGRLQCPGHATRAAHVLLKLKDIDDGPNGDDIMDEGYSSEQGNFHLYGCARDAYGVIDATLDVKHNCTGKPLKLVVTIPKQFVGGTYNFTVNLASPPTNDIFKTVNYTADKLQPMCNQEHSHIHYTDRRRRDSGDEDHTHAPGQTHHTHAPGESAHHDSHRRRRDSGDEDHTHEPGHTHHTHEPGHTHHTHAPGESAHQHHRRAVGTSSLDRYGSGRAHVEHGWGGTQYSMRNRNQQCINAVGQLKCRPDKALAKQVRIQLIDEDKREGQAADELIDTVYSTDNGNFHAFGCASDTTGNIDPFLIIHHKCGGGQHVLKVKIPEAKIGGVFNETLDLQAPSVQYTVDNYSGRMPSMCDDLHAWGRNL